MLIVIKELIPSKIVDFLFFQLKEKSRWGVSPTGFLSIRLFIPFFLDDGIGAMTATTAVFFNVIVINNTGRMIKIPAADITAK